MPDAAIREVAVVVPARDEEATIEAAIAAIHRSASHLPATLRTTVLVVANGCSDETVSRACASGATTLETNIANVGAARSVGVARAIGRRRTTLDGLWIASTDADSEVPEGWLQSQIKAATAGADVFLGTIALSANDSESHPGWSAAYAEPLRLADHGHVHGANLGFRASTYVAAGGFRPLLCAEDVDLVGRIRSLGARITWVPDVAVVTSARHDPRALGGVGSDLAASG